jgi:hypothetical protein
MNHMPAHVTCWVTLCFSPGVRLSMRVVVIRSVDSARIMCHTKTPWNRVGQYGWNRGRSDGGYDFECQSRDGLDKSTIELGAGANVYGS